MGYLSRKKLAEVLIELGRLKPGYDYRRLDNEVYGSTACIYLRMAKSRKDRKALETELKRRGFAVNTGYWPESSCVEVVVSYFKGWHWDE